MRRLCILLLLGPIFGCTHTTQRPVDVDVEGHRLHLLAMGQDCGRPSVVLESGMGGGVGWEHTRSEIAKFAQLVTYDRAGIGQSQAGPEPRDAKTIARELHAALHQAGVKPPYVLAGQSLGGLYVQVFAAEYPDETAGLILVDPTFADAKLALSADEVRRWYMTHEPDDWPRVEDKIRDKPEGVRSFLACKYKLIEEFLQTVPQPRRSEMRREWWAVIDRLMGDHPRSPPTGGARQEGAVMTDSIRQAITARPLPKVPTILLAAGRIDLDEMPTDALTPNVLALRAEARRWRMAAYQQWADATAGAKLIIVPGSGHDIESDRPHAVIDAVRAVLRYP